MVAYSAKGSARNSGKRQAPALRHTGNFMLSSLAVFGSLRRSSFEPAYLRLFRSGELAERARSARQRLESCDLCARYCQVDRRESIRGAVCRTGERAIVYSASPHHGEEDCLRGSRGSGTIFFSWCNMRCVYCQNWEIAWEGEGRETSDEALAQMMLRLQAQGCHNINFVTPSHVVTQILAAVNIAAKKGLRLPLVYNTSGYDSCRFTLQCGTHVLLDFNHLSETEVSLEAFQLGLPEVFSALKVGLIDRSIDRIVGQ